MTCGVTVDFFECRLPAGVLLHLHGGDGDPAGVGGLAVEEDTGFWKSVDGVGGGSMLAPSQTRRQPLETSVSASSPWISFWVAQKAASQSISQTFLPSLNSAWGWCRYSFQALALHFLQHAQGGEINGIEEVPLDWEQSEDAPARSRIVFDGVEATFRSRRQRRLCFQGLLFWRPAFRGRSRHGRPVAGRPWDPPQPVPLLPSEGANSCCWSAFACIPKRNPISQGTDPNIRRYVGLIPDVAEEFAHEGLAKTHDLPLGLPWGSRV